MNVEKKRAGIDEWAKVRVSTMMKKKRATEGGALHCVTTTAPRTAPRATPTHYFLRRSYRAPLQPLRTPPTVLRHPRTNHSPVLLSSDKTVTFYGDLFAQSNLYMDAPYI